MFVSVSGLFFFFHLQLPASRPTFWPECLGLGREGCKLCVYSVSMGSMFYIVFAAFLFRSEAEVGREY